MACALSSTGAGTVYGTIESGRERGAGRMARAIRCVRFVIKAQTSYASGEDRLRELAGMSERVRSGVDAGVVSTSQRDPIADDGYDAEVGGGVARGGCASATTVDCHTLDPGLRAAGGDIQIQCRAIAVHTRFGERFRGGSGERSHHVPTVFPTFYLGTYGNRTDLSSTKTSIFIGVSCDSGNAWDPLK